jgi:hypothetical protein
LIGGDYEPVRHMNIVATSLSGNTVPAMVHSRHKTTTAIQLPGSTTTVFARVVEALQAAGPGLATITTCEFMLAGEIIQMDVMSSFPHVTLRSRDVELNAELSSVQITAVLSESVEHSGDGVQVWLEMVVVGTSSCAESAMAEIASRLAAVKEAI